MYKLLKELTIEELMSWSPCLSEDEILTLFDGRESLSLQDILALDISTKDKLWALLHPELIPEKILHEFMCQCAEEALKLVKNPDKRSIEAIEAKRKWLKGEISDEQLAAARRDATYSSAYFASASAVSASAVSAASSSAYFVASAASSVADTTADDAWEKPLEILLKLLEGQQCINY